MSHVEVLVLHGALVMSSEPYYKDDLNTLYLGDAVEVMRTLEDESFDLVITSPPYNLKNSTGNGFVSAGSSAWNKAFTEDGLGHGYDKHTDKLEHEDYVEWQRECLSEMLRLIKPNGAIFYNHKWRVQGGLLQDRADIMSGFPVRQIIIWQRAGGMIFNPHFFTPTYEVIYMVAKPDFRLADKACRIGDVWKITQERNTPHPAPFPYKLPQTIISSSTAQRVLDPFVGSGTTMRAAMDLGIESVGIDNSEKYCEMTVERLAQQVLAV